MLVAPILVYPFGKETVGLPARSMLIISALGNFNTDEMNMLHTKICLTEPFSTHRLLPRVADVSF